MSNHSSVIQQIRHVHRGDRQRGFIDKRDKAEVSDAPPFTIISNNCFGAIIYQMLGLPYSTPFVGSGMAPKDFIEIARDPERFLNADLTPCDDPKDETTHYYFGHRGQRFPVAYLDGEIEMRFIHDTDFDVVRASWDRRKGRVHLNNLLFVFCQREQYTEDVGSALAELPGKKLHLAPTADSKQPHVIGIGSGEKPDWVHQAPATYQPLRRKLDIVHWIKTGEIRKPSWSMLGRFVYPDLPVNRMRARMMKRGEMPKPILP